MTFKMWLEAIPMKIPIAKIYGWRPKCQEVIDDILNKRLSHNSSNPITVSRLDNPRGCFFIIDGYHRLLETAIAGGRIVEVTIDQYVPRIERMGGAYADMVKQKVSMSETIEILKKVMQ